MHFFLTERKNTIEIVRMHSSFMLRLVNNKNEVFQLDKNLTRKTFIAEFLLPKIAFII